jgi:hypothetical protein
MKRIGVFAVLCGAVAVAEDKIPAGAKEVQPYTYSYTDAHGADWTIRQTPFGVTKWQARDVARPAVPPQPNPVTVTDLGDSFRFERKYPFGQNVWTRKKSELNDDEKELLAIAAGKDTEKK